MPMFDYKCYVCGTELQNNFVLNYKEVVECKKCGNGMARLFPDSFTPDVFPSEGITIEHAASEPITFRSKKEMREYERKHNCEFGALL